VSQYVAHHSRLNRKQLLSQYAARHSRAAKVAADQYIGRHSLLSGKRVSRQRSSKGGWSRILVPVLFLCGPLMTMFGLGAGRASPGAGQATRNANVQHRHTSVYGGWSDTTEISLTECTLVTRRSIGDMTCAPGASTNCTVTVAAIRGTHAGPDPVAGIDPAGRFATAPVYYESTGPTPFGSRLTTAIPTVDGQASTTAHYRAPVAPVRS
jgi:hypothetical protein